MEKALVIVFILFFIFMVGGSYQINKTREENEKLLKEVPQMDYKELEKLEVKIELLKDTYPDKEFILKLIYAMKSRLIDLKYEKQLKGNNE